MFETGVAGTTADAFLELFGGVAKSSNIKCHGAAGEDGEGRLKRNFGNKEPRAKTG